MFLSRSNQDLTTFQAQNMGSLVWEGTLWGIIRSPFFISYTLEFSALRSKLRNLEFFLGSLLGLGAPFKEQRELGREIKLHLLEARPLKPSLCIHSLTSDLGHFLPIKNVMLVKLSSPEFVVRTPRICRRIGHLRGVQ